MNTTSDKHTRHRFFYVIRVVRRLLVGERFSCAINRHLPVDVGKELCDLLTVCSRHRDGIHDLELGLELKAPGGRLVECFVVARHAALAGEPVSDFLYLSNFILEKAHSMDLVGHLRSVIATGLHLLSVLIQEARHGRHCDRLDHRPDAQHLDLTVP